VTAPGRIVIAAYACCGPGEGTYAVTSTDGGATWGQPILAGTVQTDRGTGGPGPYSMTVQESTTNGVKTQVLSATGPQTTEVAVLDPNYWYPGGTAMVDSLVPAAAMTDLINTQVRVFNPSTGTSYGDPANWRPPQILPGEDEPSMASTAAAAYVMTHAELNGDALQDTYRVRKVNSDGTLGAPVQASDVGNVIFGRLAASPSGGLSTFWSTGGGTEADIMSSFSADGVTFQPARMLVENADSYDLAPAITSDGSGFVAWDDNAGSVWMTGIPAAVDANACRRELTVRTGVVARVSAGCWTKSGSSYKTKADVSINGIEFVTGSGPDTVTIDMRTHKLTAGKGVVQKAGFIVFAKDSGTWDLDKLTTFDHLTGSLFDFGMGGHATVSFAAGKATLKINVKLPDPFDPVTGVATLFTTLDGGLQANEVRVEAKHATVGPITIDNLLMFYDSAQSTFGGNATLGLPGGGSMSVGIGFNHGDLVALFAAYKDGPPFPIPLTAGVWLNGVGFGYDGTDGFRLSGGADLGIPSPKGAVEIRAIGDPPGTGGGINFWVPKSHAGFQIDVTAQLYLWDFHLGSASAVYRWPADFSFNVQVGIGWEYLGIHGGVSGRVNPPSTYEIGGNVEVCVVFCGGGDFYLGTKGFGASAHLKFWGKKFCIMAGYIPGDGMTGGFTCNMGRFTVTGVGVPGPGGAWIDSSHTVHFPSSQQDQTFALDIPGNGGLPSVRIKQPDGSVLIESDPADLTKALQVDKALLLPLPDQNSVRVMVSIPPTTAGASFTLEPGEGGAPIVKGANRSVEFAETGKGGGKQLKSYARSKGKFTYRSSPGKAGKRKLVMRVLNADGLPISQQVVATYQVPGWTKPKKPTAIKLTWRKGKLKVTWKGTAPMFRVTAKIADGRILVLPTKKHAVVIPAVDKKERVVVSVRGLLKNGVTGKSATKKRQVVRRRPDSASRSAGRSGAAHGRPGRPGSGPGSSRSPAR
jgi:hypothetical protein